MVADNIDAGVAIAAADQSSVPVVTKDELPAGNYILVGVDIDTTGRRLIDEIVQLAAYTPTDHFEQYIMPYMNLNPAARQRHQVRVISIGFYRMLKSMQTYKIIKSKSEIAALKDFLNWLEQLKAKAGPGSDGIVLLYHEERKFIPYMILESLKKYGLLDRFTKSVKSFANSLSLAKASMGDTNIKHYSLRKLSKILSKSKEDETNASASTSGSASTSPSDSTMIDTNDIGDKRSAKNGIPVEKDLFDGNASVRAKLAFNVALQLSNSDRNPEPESSEALVNMFNALKPFAKLVGSDIQELDTQNENLERQNSFRPLFLNYFKTTLYHRVRAVKFRIVLAENGFDLNTLNAIWADKRIEGLDMALQSIDTIKSEDKTELLELLDSYFDPNKTTIKPVVKSTNNRRRNRRNNGQLTKNGGPASSRSASTEFGAGGDKSQSVSSVPDSTTKTPSPNKTSSRSQRKRNSRHSLGGTPNGLKVADSSSSGKAELNNSAPPTISVSPVVAQPTPTPVAITASN
ncbi:maternal protein exuperantia [Drosophila eugracilis]|uniref:maternal protein exuperantia n=1 Tax=Drosophila eugracilis TaxID=29029 RepID=UPI0007E79A4E|nr:maternal protein exuperantia [Drosophila eugracilis]XP_017073046.1 maternal protein exuperantia [Drosophila eugracilis]XP_017073047.1 maternal protein exuperantia [Drosophila eugracilis]XP_017073048.1 maternal protein exuperantia [Drosophila eugracilis]